jgi:hypothetical protein
MMTFRDQLTAAAPMFVGKSSAYLMAKDALNAAGSPERAVTAFMSAVSKGAEPLRAVLTDQELTTAALRFLRQVKDDLAGGKAAPKDKPQVEANRSAGGGQSGDDAPHAVAPPSGRAIQSTGAAPPPRDRAQSLKAMAEAGRAVAASILDRFQVNGRPLRALRVEEAEAWAARSARNARFVQLVISGLPPRAVIGEFLSDADAEQRWAMANETPPLLEQAAQEHHS